MVRAMDEALALQPRDMCMTLYSCSVVVNPNLFADWNVLSMMKYVELPIISSLFSYTASSNWWFRVAIHRVDGNTVRFEHPTLAGTASGGWMERLKNEGQDILKPKFGRKAPSVPHVQPQGKEVIMKGTHVDRTITVKQLQTHRNAEQPWFVVQGEGMTHCFPERDTLKRRNPSLRCYCLPQGSSWWRRLYHSRCGGRCGMSFQWSKTM